MLTVLKKKIKRLISLAISVEIMNNFGYMVSSAFKQRRGNLFRAYSTENQHISCLGAVL